MATKITKILSPKEAVHEYNISLEVATRALDNIASMRAPFVAISGKIGSGKDTVAPLVVNALGHSDAVHEFFARPLKEEVNQVIDFIRKASNLDEAITLVHEHLQPVNFIPAVEALYDDVKTGVVQSAYDRTPSTRKALQLWGTEVRRTQDEDYWVRKAMKSSLELIASGQSIYVTDARFPNEVAAIETVGAHVVRLVVSPEEQARRIWARDGHAPSEEAINHASETALDDYEFEITIDTDALSASEVANEAIKAILAM